MTLVTFGLLDLETANAQPTAVNDFTMAVEGSFVEVPLLEDDVPDLYPLDPYSITVLTEPQYGELFFNSYTGEVYYISDEGYTGPDDFSYVVADISGEWSNVAQSSLVVGDNLPPVITDFWLDSVTDNMWIFCGYVSDETPASCVFSIDSSEFDGQQAAGALIVRSDGSFEFSVPHTGFPQSEVTIQAKDPSGQESNVATFSPN